MSESSFPDDYVPCNYDNTPAEVETSIIEARAGLQETEFAEQKVTLKERDDLVERLQGDCEM